MASNPPRRTQDPRHTPLTFQSVTEILVERTEPPQDILPTAPPALVSLLDRSVRHRPLLRRLLTDSRMKLSWRRIRKRLPEASDQQNLWYEIVYAWSRSKAKVVPQATIRKKYLRVADQAKRLADTIADGPLDRRAFEFFPHLDAALAFSTRQPSRSRSLAKKKVSPSRRSPVPLTAELWAGLRDDERSDIALRALPWWPSMTDLLYEVEHQAKRCANEVSADKRIVDRNTISTKRNYFIRFLAAYFVQHLGGPMEGTLANIASVAFQCEIFKENVHDTLRHSR